MDINYYMKIQNAYGTKNKREKELAKTNREMSKHFGDTFDTWEVLLNNTVTDLMIVNDTSSNPFRKKIVSRHSEPFHPGDYVFWNKRYWLITLADPDDKTWNRGYMHLCTGLLRWQNEKGEIIERWGYSEDLKHSSSGISANEVVTVGDSRYDFILPIDSETGKLKRDMRFPMDFEDSEEPDIYKLTNRNVKPNDESCSGRGGTMTVTLSFDVFHRDRDKKVLLGNGTEVWICDYRASISPSPSDADNTVFSISGSPRLKKGVIKTYTAHFTGRRGENVTPPPFLWNVVCDCDIVQTVDGNNIQLQALDKESINKTLELQLIVGSSAAAKLEITITDNF